MRVSRCSFTLTIAALLFGQVQETPAGASGDLVARNDFLELCADCHGVTAKGNGPLTKNLTKVPPDLTRIKEHANGKFNEKNVFDWIIGLSMSDFHGTREMPIWGD
jgi:mono/diheme cytochrome c family protein